MHFFIKLILTNIELCVRIHLWELIMSKMSIDVDKIDEEYSSKLDFENDYRMRRSQQIIVAKLKANKQKRIKQKHEKRANEKEQKTKDAISVALIQEYVKNDIEMQM